MLPVFASSELFAFRAELNGKYLQSVYPKKASGSRIEASADTVVANARARFLVERSEREDGLMHVRCCYNNKYWVPVLVQDSGISHWIIGTADEPEEDLSSPSCTLFQACPVKNNSIRFFHSGIRKTSCVVSIIGNKTYLRKTDAAEDQEPNPGIFTVVSLARQKELPKYVAFKGDNGKYLSTKLILGNGIRKFGKVIQKSSVAVGPILMGPFYLGSKSKADRAFEALNVLGQQFETEDIEDASVIFTTYTNDDGSVRIASNEGGFWKRSTGENNGNLIWSVNMEDKNNRDTLFEVVTGNGFVALRNLGNNKFCRRFDFDGKVNWLSACDDTISQYARLKLEEPVISQEIYDVKFNLDEARIYNNELITMDSDARTNHTKEVQTGTFSFKKITEIVSTWERTVSSKIVVGEKFSTKVNQTPVVLGAEVTLSSESASSRRDTGSSRDSEERTVTQNFTISAGETITAKFVASRASCDVPFSYKQKSVLTNGKEIVTIHDDGIYTGVNKYDFHITLTRS